MSWHRATGDAQEIIKGNNQRNERSELFVDVDLHIWVYQGRRETGGNNVESDPHYLSEMHEITDDIANYRAKEGTKRVVESVTAGILFTNMGYLCIHFFHMASTILLIESVHLPKPKCQVAYVNKPKAI